jgi:hypothetical protein
MPGMETEMVESRREDVEDVRRMEVGEREDTPDPELSQAYNAALGA